MVFDLPIYPCVICISDPRKTRGYMWGSAGVRWIDFVRVYVCEKFMVSCCVWPRVYTVHLHACHCMYICVWECYVNINAHECYLCEFAPATALWRAFAWECFLALRLIIQSLVCIGMGSGIHLSRIIFSSFKTKRQKSSDHKRQVKVRVPISQERRTTIACKMSPQSLPYRVTTVSFTQLQDFTVERVRRFQTGSRLTPVFFPCTLAF